MALRLSLGGLQMCSQIILKRCWLSWCLLSMPTSQAHIKQAELMSLCIARLGTYSRHCTQ